MCTPMPPQQNKAPPNYQGNQNLPQYGQQFYQNQNQYNNQNDMNNPHMSNSQMNMSNPQLSISQTNDNIMQKPKNQNYDLSNSCPGPLA